MLWACPLCAGIGVQQRLKSSNCSSGNKETKSGGERRRQIDREMQSEALRAAKTAAQRDTERTSHGKGFVAFQMQMQMQNRSVFGYAISQMAPLAPVVALNRLSDPTEIPPYRETGVAIPLSHCVSCGIADYRWYTPAAFRENGLSQSKDKPWNEGIAGQACL